MLVPTCDLRFTKSYLRSLSFFVHRPFGAFFLAQMYRGYRATNGVIQEVSNRTAAQKTEWAELLRTLERRCELRFEVVLTTENPRACIARYVDPAIPPQVS